jgi:RHS repeat-associated protein
LSFYVDGVEVGTDSEAPFAVDYALPADAAPGALTVEVRAQDRAGRVAIAHGEIAVSGPPSAGLGVIAGEVLDDESGLPVAGARVQLVALGGAPLDPAPETTSDAQGLFRLASAAGVARVAVSRAGWSSADRLVPVVAGRRTDPFDARLSALREAVAVRSVLGATLEHGEARLEVPPGALSSDAELRFTALGAQSLVARLPLGWSPAGALDLSPHELAFAISARVSLRALGRLPAGRAAVLARFDEASGAWIAQGEALPAEDGALLEAELARGGQWAFLLGDAAPHAPPAPAAGEPLAGVAPSALPAVQVEVLPNPEILVAEPQARSQVGVQALPEAPLPSGTPLSATLAESFDFTGGAALYPEPRRQDFALYAFPPAGEAPGSLGADFSAMPSRAFDALRLELGVIDVAVSLPPDPQAPRGALVGSAGADVIGAGGARLAVPAGAAQAEIPVVLEPLAAQDFPAALPPGLSFLAGVSLDLHGAELAQPARLLVPAPPGFAAGDPALAVRLLELGGASHLEVLGTAELAGGELALESDPRGDASADFPGVRRSGRIAFLASQQPLAFATGSVNGPGGPFAGALVSAGPAGLAARSDGAGRFALALPLGGASLAARDPATGDEALAEIALASPGELVDLALALPSTPPRVVAVSPADGETAVPRLATVTVELSEPVVVPPGTPLADALAVSSAGARVAGAVSLSPDRRSLSFVPAARLASDALHEIRVAAALEDDAGRALGADFAAQFSTADETPTAAPGPGEVVATIPGVGPGAISIVSGGPGTAEPSGLAIVKNLRTGALTTLVPNADGSFSGAVPAARADRLELVLRDARGNETRVAIAAFRDPDGRVVVGSAGGVVTGAGGVAVEIPPGALPDGTPVKVEPVAEAELPLAVPPAFGFAGGLRLDLGGAKPSAPLDLSVPAPADASALDQVLVLRPLQLPRRQAWTLDDRAHFDAASGSYRTASPPFPGALGSSTWSFVRFEAEIITPGPNGALDTAFRPPGLATDDLLEQRGGDFGGQLIAPGASGSLEHAPAGDDVVQRDCASYVAQSLSFAADVVIVPVAFGVFLPVVVVADPSVEHVVLPASCNSTLTIEVRNPTSEELIQSVELRAPAAADDIYFPPGVLSDDGEPPQLVWDNTSRRAKLDSLEFEFSEPMDAERLRLSLVVRNARGQVVAGAVAVSPDGTRARFRPTAPLRFAEEYTVSFEGATDLGGNPIASGPVEFRSFEPSAFPALHTEAFLAQALEKCRAGSCSHGALDVAQIGDTLFLANGRRTADEQFHDPADPARLIAVDVGDPEHPRLIGRQRTATNPKAVAALAGVSFQASDGELFSGDLLAVVGGGREPGGELDGKLELYDVTECTRRPVVVTDCLQDGLEPLRGVKLLSTATGTPPREGVPPEAGVPLQVQTLVQQAEGPSGDDVALAFAATVPVGLAGVDVPGAFNVASGGDRAPDALARGEFLDLALLRTQLLAVEVDPASGQSFLDVFSPQLARVATLPLPGPAARVAAFEGLVADQDGDGRVLAEEEDDGDAVSASAEIFDLAIVSSGAVSGVSECQAPVSGELPPGVEVPVPCGRLYVLDLSPYTALAHPGQASLLAEIPMPAPAFSLAVDPAARLATVELRGQGLGFVDLSHLDSAGLLDLDRDAVDDRVLGVFDKSDVVMARVELDLARAIAVASGPSSGVELVCVDGEKCGEPGARLRLRSAALVGQVSAPSLDGTVLDFLLTPESWQAGSEICFDLDVPPGAAFEYELAEFPLFSDALMLDLAGGGGTGTLDASNPRICLPTRPAEPFPLASDVRVDLREPGGPIVKSLLVRLTPLMVRAEDVRVSTEIDRVNGLTCPQGGTLGFELLYPAAVTVELDGEPLQEETFLEAGFHEIPISTDRVSLPGEHPFEITAVVEGADGGEPIETKATGAVVHDLAIHGAYPIAHTLVKGVDLVDGHVSLSAEDAMIPGRGLSLDFSRSYGSSGISSSGPLGAGWSHSYAMSLVKDSCGRYVVIGGEGSGNAFSFDGTRYRPQIGYHSTLVRDPADSSQFDFFTKARVRHHFERNPALPGEVYELRFLEEPNGNRIAFDYVSGDGDPRTLDAVMDSSGRSLHFAYQKIYHDDRIVKISGRSAGTGGDLLGLEIAYEYDAKGNLTKVTRKSPDPAAGLGDERVDLYAYSTADPEDPHNLVSATDPNGNTTSYVYHAESDSLPGALAFGLRNREVLKRIEEPEAVVTRFFYDFPAGRRSVSDPRSEDPADPAPPPATVYTLDAYGATVKIEAPLGKTTRMEWCTGAPHPSCPNPEGAPGVDALMVSMVDAEGRTHLYEYGDGRGNLTRETIVFTGGEAPVTLTDGVTPVEQVVSTTSYDPLFNKLTSRTDAEGRTTLFLVDSTYPGKPNFCPDPTPGKDTGNLLGTRDALGNVSCRSYAANGDLLSVRDPRSFTTSYTDYDAHGNPTRVVDPVGNVTLSSFDERSRVIETSDSFGHHTRTAWDGLDRKSREEKLDDLGQGGTPQITEWRYRPGGQLETETDGLGQITRTLYDGMNRAVERREEGVLQADGSNQTLVRSWAYGRSGLPTVETDPRGISRLHRYDALGRRVETRVAGPFGPTQTLESFEYDLVDNVLAQTDLHGHRSEQVVDGLYRVVRRILPFSHAFTDVPGGTSAALSTAYDRAGNKVLETDANGNPLRFEYDALHRLVRKVDAAGNQVDYAYDSAGNLVREANQTTGLVSEFLGYDGRNRLTHRRQTVPLGAPGLGTAVYDWVYGYADAGNVTLTTNPRGVVQRVVRDGLDRIVQRTADVEGLGLTTLLGYDGNGNLRTVQDPQGGDLDVVHEWDGLGRKIRSRYVETPTDTGPVTEEWSYDENGNLVRAVDRRGIVSRTRYDNLDRPLERRWVESITNGGLELVQQSWAYDDAGNAVTEIDANGNATTTWFDGLHRPRIVDDPHPNEAFDAQGAGPFPLGLAVMEHDGVNLRALVDKKGQRVERDYDALNRPVAIREADGSGAVQTQLSAAYLDAELRLVETDRRGIVNTVQLDALGRARQRRRAGAGLEERYGNAELLLASSEYDGNGNLTAQVDGQGNRVEFVYDALDRLVQQMDGAGSALAATTTRSYDGVGNLLELKDGRPHGGRFDVAYAYDARYRRVGETNGEGETRTFRYDAGDLLIEVSEPGGASFTTRYRHDEGGRLLAVDETPRADASTAAGVTRFFYDANGNRIAQQDANGNLQTWRFDALDRMTEWLQHTRPGALSDATVRGADPRGGSLLAGGDGASALGWRYGWDANSNLASLEDPRGQRIEHTHDHLDRLVRQSYSNHAAPGLDYQVQSIETTYDGNGNVTTRSERKRVAGADVVELSVMSFDALDRLESSTRFDRGDAVGKRIAYTYDVQGNRLSVTDPDGFSTFYSYDARNRLATVTTQAGVTSYEWWEDDLLKRVLYPNGTLHERSAATAYDRADRVREIVNRPTQAGAPPFSTYSYGYDENGNRILQLETQAALSGGLPLGTTYTYDKVHRLLRVTYGALGELSYSYEPNGNRASERGVDPRTGEAIDRSYRYAALPGRPDTTFDGVNALTEVVDHLDASRSVTYEYDRNLNQAVREEGTARSVSAFGARNELLLATGAGGASLSFDYDHDKLRVKKISAGSGETRYRYDGGAVLLEYDGAALGFPTVRRYDYGYELLSLSHVSAGGTSRATEFYLGDALMSTVGLTDELGSLVQSHRYDAWGGSLGTAGSSDNARQYTGHYRDEETGLHYFGARYYDDETGRFLSQDPLPGEPGVPPSLHRYLYARANPLRWVDPTGMASVEQIGSGGSGAARKVRYEDRLALANSTSEAAWEAVKWNVTEHIPGIFKGAHDAAKQALGETVLTAGDIAFEGLKWALPPEARQRVEESELNRAMSQAGQALQEGATVPKLIAEGLKGTVMAPIEFARTISDPHASSEAMGGALFNLVASVEGLASGAKMALGAAKLGARAPAALARTPAASRVLMGGLDDLADAARSAPARSGARSAPGSGARAAASSGQALSVSGGGLTVFSGHGTWDVDAGFFIVPEGVSIRVPSNLGGTLGNRLGNLIETNQIPGDASFIIYGPGRKIPDFTLHPPGNLPLQGNPTTVSAPTRLSALVRQHIDDIRARGGECVWAACTFREGGLNMGVRQGIGGMQGAPLSFSARLSRVIESSTVVRAYEAALTAERIQAWEAAVAAEVQQRRIAAWEAAVAADRMRRQGGGP